MGIGSVQSWAGRHKRVSQQNNQHKRYSNNFVKKLFKSEQSILSKLTQVAEDNQQTTGQHMATHGGEKSLKI